MLFWLQVTSPGCLAAWKYLCSASRRTLPESVRGFLFILAPTAVAVTSCPVLHWSHSSHSAKDIFFLALFLLRTRMKQPPVLQCFNVKRWGARVLSENSTLSILFSMVVEGYQEIPSSESHQTLPGKSRHSWLSASGLDFNYCRENLVLTFYMSKL